MIIKMPSAALGAMPDASPDELDLGSWSAASNVMFRNGYVERAGGMKQVFGAPSIVPTHVQQFRSGQSIYWLHAGDNSVHIDDGSRRADITRASGRYTGTASDRWTGGAMNGLVLLNNGVDVPQRWTGAIEEKLVDLPNWPSGLRCRIMRPWKNYVFVLDTTDGGVRHPQRVRWSALADPGADPPTWDLADPTHDAGEVDLSETFDTIVDMLPLADGAVIYKSSSAHLVRWIGGQSVFSFQRLPGEHGMLSVNCGTNTPVGHVVLTRGDVVVNTGGMPRSIANARIRKTLFDEIDKTYSDRACFVASNPSKNEVWICYPTGGSASCTRAAIWNWIDDTWSFRDLPNVTAGATGQLPGSLGASWADMSGPWSAQTQSWGSMSSDADVSMSLVLSTAAPALAVVDRGIDDLGQPVSVVAERTGIHFGDPQAVKTLSAIWPRFEGPEGSVVGVQVGASMTANGPVKWSSPRRFIIGKSTKVDTSVTGRYLALRITN